MNWTEDPWFSRHHANELTPEFKEWWPQVYGYPDNYADDRHEYWVRCAFAWIGWRAAKSTP